LKTARATFVFALLTACRPSAGASDFPTYVARELGELHAETTPAAWMQAHPNDSLAIFERRLATESDERWCARAMQRSVVGGASAVRYAYFYPPELPADLALPPAENARLVQEHCRLGAIWVETPATDSTSGRALAEQTRDALTRRYGPVRAAPDPWVSQALSDPARAAAVSQLAGAESMRLGLDFFGAAYWRVAGRWTADSGVVVSAFDRGLEAGRARVLAFATFPFTGLRAGRASIENEERAERKMWSLVVQATRLSGIDTAIANRLLATFAAAEKAFLSSGPDAARPQARVVESRLVAAAKDWIAASRDLDPPHRAAALLAIDQVLGSAAMGYVLAQEGAGPTRQALTVLGARFVYNELGGGDGYVHSWLDEARGLDSSGPAGRLATIALLRLGFNESGMCGGAEHASQRVSAAAEQLLQSSTDSVENAELHFLAADGYTDIVALAVGAAREYADSSEFVAAAPQARRRAIEHYRQGIARDPRSPDSRDAWLTAWRLLAGLPPTTTRFYCVYD